VKEKGDRPNVIGKGRAKSKNGKEKEGIKWSPIAILTQSAALAKAVSGQT